MKHTKQTLDQRRAQHALKNVRSIQNADYGHYVSYVSALPATIVMNGLGQALATLLAKAKSNQASPHYLLYKHIASWLSEQVKALEAQPENVIERLMEHGQDVYVQAQVEAMAYLNWLKQFARAYLREKEGRDD